MKFYDQIGFIQEMQGVLHIMKSTNLINYINRSEKKCFCLSS